MLHLFADTARHIDAGRIDKITIRTGGAVGAEPGKNSDKGLLAGALKLNRSLIGKQRDKWWECSLMPIAVEAMAGDHIQ